MTLHELIDKFFTKEQLTKDLSSYILYYQIALGRNVYESFHDEQLAIAKLKEMNLTLTLNDIISKILEFTLVYYKSDNFDKIFDRLLMQQALLHSLEDFVTNDTTLLNMQSYIMMKKKLIEEEKFFGSDMKMQFLKEYPHMHEHYEKFITDDYIEELKKIILQNI